MSIKTTVTNVNYLRAPFELYPADMQKVNDGDINISNKYANILIFYRMIKKIGAEKLSSLHF